MLWAMADRPDRPIGGNPRGDGGEASRYGGQRRNAPRNGKDKRLRADDRGKERRGDNVGGGGRERRVSGRGADRRGFERQAGDHGSGAERRVPGSTGGGTGGRARDRGSAEAGRRRGGATGERPRRSDRGTAEAGRRTGGATGERPRRSDRGTAEAGRRTGRGTGERRTDLTGRGSRRVSSDERATDRAPRRRLSKRDVPPIDPHVTGRELDGEIRQELSTLGSGVAGTVARHLVMAGRLIDTDPELAYRHAQEARRMAGRVGVVREAAGQTAYAAGRYGDALAELRTARRITGSVAFLPMMADSERGLGHPHRALDLAASPDVEQLDSAGKAEMLIVAAGAHKDLGNVDEALRTLQVKALTSRRQGTWVARLRYAYADLLLEAGRKNEAVEWFSRAADVDVDGETDADDRLAELTGVTVVATEDEDQSAEDPFPLEAPEWSNPEQSDEDLRAL
jgi:hypothetical protein